VQADGHPPNPIRGSRGPRDPPSRR
jgi:hypothetical protein